MPESRMVVSSKIEYFYTEKENNMGTPRKSIMKGFTCQKTPGINLFNSKSQFLRRAYLYKLISIQRKMNMILLSLEVTSNQVLRVFAPEKKLLILEGEHF